MPTIAPAGTTAAVAPNLVGPFLLVGLLVLVWAAIALSDRLGRYRAEGATGFLRGAGFYLAVKSLTFEPPGEAGNGDPEQTILRVAWLARNDWTEPRDLPPAGVGLLVEGVAYTPFASEPDGPLALQARATAELVTRYRLPAPVATRLAAGEATLAATLRLYPADAEPLAVAPLDVGWLLRRPAD